MARGGDEARRSARADDLAGAREWGVHLDAHFQVDLVIEVDGDMPTGSRDVLGADDPPHHPARIGNDPR
jgi:hypothetical protein